ncbi:putative COP9 signalosome complex subunit 7a [Glarea lozoyensis 74030]|uniref:Putative COP9 signalosome complex subunit 7a n=1 Tax=Glarea lozoyensis (strain ATCC 74030 / MF5533) TaxID=1104152 RepID=H0EH32_GLAL7|nr:putative COP9 signalosome complex subunit 7a [Glarea lozoyensis 74030]
MEQTKALNALEPFLALSKSATSPRAAADLVIRATSSPNTFIFSELLNPYHQNVLVSSVSPLRDLEPNSIPSMLDTLSEWSSRCTSTLADLERQIAGIKAEAARRHKEEAEWSAEVEKITDDKIKGDAAKGPLNNFMSSITGGLGMGRKLGGGQGKRGMADGDAWEDDMDLDEEDDDIPHRNTRAAKKRGFGGLGGGK